MTDLRRDGNDGPWSTFTVQIGTPAQNVKVLISTAGSSTWAVAPEGCQSGDPTDCMKLRGGEFNYTESSTYSPNMANFSTSIYSLDLESVLGYTGNGRFGFDTISLGILGTGGPTLANQTVAGIAAKDFFLGYFGLRPTASHFTPNDNPIFSYIQNLKNQSKIPSTTWAYTAGNQYRLSEVLGSLTLGGYDSSRFTPNKLSIPLSANVEKELTVNINSIATGTGTSLLSTPISAFLDSTVPYIYLPISACTLFEATFGIIWDDASQIYIVNNTQHLRLQTKNPSVTFTLGSNTSTTTVNITLPYAAFDLTASWPLVENSTSYFPLQRANDSSQYTLGRTFFQEAYVIADYERNNFSVSACKWDSSPQDIVTIYSLSNSTEPHTTSASKIPTSAIAGIAAGGAILLLVLALLFFLWYQPLKQKRRAAELAANEVHTQQDFILKPELDNTSVVPVVQVYEAEGTKVQPPVQGGVNIPVTICEMPAREEVAAEMMAWSPAAESCARKGWRKGWRGERRPVVQRSVTIDTTSSLSSGFGSYPPSRAGSGRGDFPLEREQENHVTPTLTSKLANFGYCRENRGASGRSFAERSHGTDIMSSLDSGPVNHDGIVSPISPDQGRTQHMAGLDR